MPLVIVLQLVNVKSWYAEYINLFKIIVEAILYMLLLTYT